jgi:uncharacterized protein with HEPN domain
MPADRQNGLLRDILDSALRIREYLAGAKFEAFLVDPQRQDAVLRRLEIIGEAAGRLSPETRALFPNLPFQGMRGMRNIIAHDYGEVDLDLVWTTASRDLPVLIATLEDYFLKAGDSGSEENKGLND